MKKDTTDSTWFRFGANVILGLVTIFVFMTLNDGSQARAVETGLIVSAAEIDYPPFCIVDSNGRASGFSVELMQAALSTMGQSVTFRTGPWKDVKGWLEKGDIQALPLVGRTPEREAVFDFTFPYMSIYGAIVVRADTTNIQDLSDLKGRTVAVMKDDNAEEFLRREDRGIRIHTTATFDEALRELSDGHYDAVVIQRLVALRLIQETGLNNLKVVHRPIEGFRQDFCFAVREGDRETLALLNEGLALVMADGTYRHLHAKWFAALELPSNRRIVVGGDHNYPPYEYLDEKGHPAGYNVELTRAIAKELDLDIEIRLGPWTDMIQSMEKGEIDIIQGMFYSIERDQKFDFTPSHTMNHCVGIVRQGEGPPPSTLEELADMRIVVQGGDIMHDFAIANGLSDQVTPVYTQEKALQELAEGKHDCALVSRMTALYWIEKHGWKNLTIARRPLISPEYCYAVPNGHKALQSTFSEGLNILETNGEYRRIHEKWLGVHDADSLQMATILRYVALVAGPLLLVLIGFLLWSWTLRKQVALRTEELRRSKEQYRLLADNTLDAIWTMNLDLVFTYINPACLAMTGYRPEEWIGSRLSDHCDDVNLAKMAQVIADEMAKGPGGSGVIIEAALLNRNGESFWAEIHGRVLYDDTGQATGLQGVTRDISDRKRYELRIEHLNKVLRAIRNVNQLIIHERDPDRIIQEACRLMVEHRGYFSALIVLTDKRDKPVSWAMAGHAAESRELVEILEGDGLPPCFEHLRQKEGVLRVDDRQTVCTDCPIAREFTNSQSICASLSHEKETFGSLSAAAESRIPLNDEELGLFAEMACDLAYALHFLQIENQRRLWENALRESESRFRMLAELAPVGIVISDERERVIYVSPKFVELFGYTSSDMPSVEEWWQLAYPDETLRSRIRQEWEAAVAEAGRTGSEIRPMEYPVTCKDGTVRQIEFRMVSTDRLNFRVFTDVTERRRTEEEREKLQVQLLQAQKMEAVGRLAGGVAHDFNNMLNVIIGYTELALSQLKPDDAITGNLEEVLSAAGRSADITRQLLAFARKQTVAPRVLDLNEIVEGMLKMLRRLIGEDIDLYWKPGSGLGSVTMAPSQIDQILANLCVNARDAIAGVGRLTIETTTVHFDQAYCADHAGFVPGKYVMLAVSDDGCGMDKETLKNLFEPFFTTKEVGKGTGLGLATVYGIVKQNEGFINVYSEPGQGTTFRIYLPRYAGTMDGMEIQAKENIIPGNGETVLLVEDEASVLKLARIILEGLGYTVMAAANPAEGERLAEAHAGQIDLLITDVVMPTMNGRELSGRLHARYPGIKTLFMSGYTANVIAHHGVLDKGVHFIQKPFSREGLATKVRNALEG
ncbi:MAG: transporter substrate-binding domain-containing protein [Desulfatirhabdiaceae bacterium]